MSIALGKRFAATRSFFFCRQLQTIADLISSSVTPSPRVVMFRQGQQVERLFHRRVADRRVNAAAPAGAAA